MHTLKLRHILLFSFFNVHKLYICQHILFILSCFKLFYVIIFLIFIIYFNLISLFNQSLTEWKFSKREKEKKIVVFHKGLGASRILTVLHILDI